jgi:hypothetical protein
MDFARFRNRVRSASPIGHRSSSLSCKPCAGDLFGRGLADFAPLHIARRDRQPSGRENAVYLNWGKLSLRNEIAYYSSTVRPDLQFRRGNVVTVGARRASTWRCAPCFPGGRGVVPETSYVCYCPCVSCGRGTWADQNGRRRSLHAVAGNAMAAVTQIPRR